MTPSGYMVIVILLAIYVDTMFTVDETGVLITIVGFWIVRAIEANGKGSE